jgi:glycosyltransferase involved in cell wall biosynthesis
MTKLSIIVPVYYNASSLPELHQELLKAVDQLEGTETEMVFVDDGSRDESFEVLSSLATTDRRCKLVKLSRNYGSPVAVLAGLQWCSGDCATIISADLQDPPSLIPQMHKYWREGYSAVLAVRDSREDPPSTKLFAAVFHRLMKRFALKDYPPGGCDLALIDRRVIDVLINMQEKNSNLLTQILWTGYSHKLIPYKREERKVGKSRWTFSKRLKLLIDSFTAFSYLPLRLMSLMGFVIAAVGFLYAILIIIRRMTHGAEIEGWTSLMVVVLVISGALLISMGILGEYLWRVLEEVRRRPTFLVERTIGFDKPENPTSI